MPVVINEFEVVAEPPPKVPVGPESSEAGSSEEVVNWTISDIERIVCRQGDRARRLRAD
jgi:hypothetical protein